MLNNLQTRNFVTGRLLPVALLLFAFFLSETFAFAQDEEWTVGETGSLSGILSGFRHGIAKISQIILVLGAAFSGVMVAMAVMSGEQQSMKRFGIWLIGCVIGVILINIMEKAGLTASDGNLDAGAFSYYKRMIKDILMVLLNIVSIVPVVSKVLQVINGEKEGTRQLFRWFVVSIFGQILLTVI